MPTGRASSGRAGTRHLWGPELKPGRRLAGFVALSLLTRGLSLLIDVIDKDEAAHVVGAWQLLDGGVLYTDFVDNKPPLLYVFYALAQILFGRGLLSVHVLSVLLVVPLTAWAASAFFAHDRRGLWAGVILILYSAAFFGHDMLAAHGELLALLPTAWALVQVREPERARNPWRLLACGMLLGLAVLLKPTSGLYLLGVAALPSCRRGIDRLASLGLGFAAPLLLTYLAFWSVGGADELVEWTLLHNLGYVANPIPWQEALERAAVSLLPFLLATAWLWWGWSRSRAGFPSRDARQLVTFTLLLSIPPVFLGLRFFAHYLVPLYLPLALGAAPWAAGLLAAPRGRLARVAIAHTLIMLVGFQASTGILYFVRTDVYEETHPVFPGMKERLRDDPCFAGGRLFVWGFAPQFYYELGLSPSSRFVVPQASLTGYVPGNRASSDDAEASRELIRVRDWDRLMQDLAERPPTYVLDTSTSGLHRWNRYPVTRFARLHRFLRDGYEKLDAVERVQIYRRRGCDGP